MASLTQWTWVWVNSGSWWWTGRPGVLWSMGVTKSQTWLSDWTELDWTKLNQEPLCCLFGGRRSPRQWLSTGLGSGLPTCSSRGVSTSTLGPSWGRTEPVEVLQERNWTRGGQEHVLDGNTLKEEGDRNARALRQEKSRRQGPNWELPKIYSSLIGCFQIFFFINLYLLPPFHNIPSPPSPRSLFRILPFQKGLSIPKSPFPLNSDTTMKSYPFKCLKWLANLKPSFPLGFWYLRREWQVTYKSWTLFLEIYCPFKGN